MNATTYAEKNDVKSDAREIIIANEDKKISKKSENRRNLLIMTGISLLVMLTAVLMIYGIIRSDPELAHRNDQISNVSENNGYVNPDSIQRLEHDASHISMKPAENSKVFIACGAGFMAVMAGAFIFVKVKETREDN